jgi:hypothetical protein
MDGRSLRDQRYQNSASWKGGQTVHSEGYVLVKNHEHHRSLATGYVYHHILVVEAAMGKPLRKGHVVHHVDGNKSNNVPSNLVVCQNQRYHKLLHSRAKSIIGCGDPDMKLCSLCGSWLPFVDYHGRGSRGFLAAYCKNCTNARARDKRRQVIDAARDVERI